MATSSDEIVKIGLRLLTQLELLLAVGVNRLDAISQAERDDLNALFIATSEAVAAVHPRSPAQARAKR